MKPTIFLILSYLDKLMEIRRLVGSAFGDTGRLTAIY